MAGPQIDNATRTRLERILEMSGGYVLDFSNASFSAFVESCLGFDPYERYAGSKAVILRRIWLSEPTMDVARLNLELLQHWHLDKLANGLEPSAFELQTYADLKATFVQEQNGASSDVLDFLGRDLGDGQFQ